jgi:mannosyl-oligosaccharide alpha-1,2-mannosidase
MVDSLDTLWIMGMKKEFAEAKEWLVKNLPSRIEHMSSGVSVFETTIRSFGGLLGAYELSREKEFLDLAQKMGSRLVQATNGQGITPYTLGGGNGGMGCHTLAESGTNQLEYRYLSHMLDKAQGAKEGTNYAQFAGKVDKFYDYIAKAPNIDGLYPNCFGRGSGKITFGADGDSFYEYLLKAWLQGGRKEKRLWDMYNKAVDGLVKHLVFTSKTDGLTYLANMNWQGGKSTSPDHSMEHLTCFVPGWLALGAKYQADKTRAAAHVKLAKDLAWTCYQMYDRQPTKIGPERVKGMKIDLSATDTREYILRPEAAEGWWYMLELTGDQKYREWGWKTFMAMEKELKVAHGYASIQDVSKAHPQKMDRMESFFLAETLKYLYLLQDPTQRITLDKYVFNTEAHPYAIFGGAADVTGFDADKNGKTPGVEAAAAAAAPAAVADGAAAVVDSAAAAATTGDAPF